MAAHACRRMHSPQPGRHGRAQQAVAVQTQLMSPQAAKYAAGRHTLLRTCSCTSVLALGSLSMIRAGSVSINVGMTGQCVMFIESQ